MRKYLLHVLIISFVFILAATASYAGEIEDAKEEVRRNPDSPEAHNSLGVCYIKIRDKSSALKQKSFRLISSTRSVYKESKLAMKAPPVKIHNEPELGKTHTADAHYNLGVASGESGKHQEAIESYKQAIRIDPDYADAHFGLGNAYGKSGKYQEAIESFKQAISTDPDNADAHYNLGNAYGESGKHQEAIESYKQAIRIDPDYKVSSVNLRSTYNKRLLVPGLQELPHINIRGNEKWGFHGYSIVQHEYEAKEINSEKIVIDRATNLMWHQSGSNDNMRFKGVKKWIKNLNSRWYAGYNDWRLPTVDEAVSLLESSKKNGDLYIDAVFDKKQSVIRTGDSKGLAGALCWFILLNDGAVRWRAIGYCDYYIRPVRSMK